MNHSHVVAYLLLIVGFTSSLVTVVGFAPEYTPIDAGQPELAAVIVLSISLGFVVTGGFWLREGESEYAYYRRVPALTLGLAAVTGIFGSLIVFRPWQYAGLAGGLRTVITGVIIAVGGGLALSSYNWFRQGVMRYPLVLLASLLAVGLFYLTHQQFDLQLHISLFALIIPAVVVVPIILVFYGSRYWSAAR